MRLTKSVIRMYAQVFSIPLAIGIGVAAAVLPVLIGNPGGLEVKITATEKLCVDQPTELRIELFHGSEENYLATVEVTAPDGTRMFKDSARTAGSKGLRLSNFKPANPGNYTVTASFQQGYSTIDGERRLKARYCA